MASEPAEQPDPTPLDGHHYKRSRQLAQILSEPITSGELAVGSALPTTRELAAKYCVSSNTVQLALRELEARGLIRCVARQGAKVLSNVETASRIVEPQKHVGVLTLGLDFSRGPWGQRIIHAAEQVLFDAGYNLLLLPLSLGEDGLPAAIKRLDRLGDTLVGIIHLVHPTVNAILGEIERRKIPWVSINRPSQASSTNFVSADNVAAGRLAARVFTILGYERATVIGWDTNRSLSGMEKFTGFCQGWLESRSTPAGMEILDRDMEAEEIDGYQAMKSIIASGNVPQGIFAFGDRQAMGALRALAEARIAVPDQVGVIGATGLPESERFSPSLSVITQPMEQIGREAAHMLIQMVQEGATQMIGRRIRGRLIVRQSLHVPENLMPQIEALNELPADALAI